MNYMVIATLNLFPSIPQIGENVTSIVCQLLLIGGFVGLMCWFKYALRGDQPKLPPASIVTGRFSGIIASPFMACLQTAVLKHFTALDDPGIIGCFIVFVLIDAAITTIAIFPLQPPFPKGG